MPPTRSPGGSPCLIQPALTVAIVAEAAGCLREEPATQRNRAADSGKEEEQGKLTREYPSPFPSPHPMPCFLHQRGLEEEQQQMKVYAPKLRWEAEGSSRP